MEKKSLIDMLEEYLRIMNSDMFEEVDKRLTKLSLTKQVEYLSVEDFILVFLSYFEHLSKESFRKVRLALYSNINIISQIVANKITKSELHQLLSSNGKIQELIEYLNYETSENLVIKQILELLLNEIAK